MIIITLNEENRENLMHMSQDNARATGKLK